MVTDEAAFLYVCPAIAMVPLPIVPTKVVTELTRLIEPGAASVMVSFRHVAGRAKRDIAACGSGEDQPSLTQFPEIVAVLSSVMP